MSTENPPPPPDNPPPDNPPPPPPTDPDWRSPLDELATRVDDLTAKVETLTPVQGPPDTQPIKRPWTARGRR